MTTLRLYTSDNQALTGLISADPTLTLPDEIRAERGGRWRACHADGPCDVYPTLGDLCVAYRLDQDAVEALLWSEPVASLSGVSAEAVRRAARLAAEAHQDEYPVEGDWDSEAWDLAEVEGAQDWSDTQQEDGWAIFADALRVEVDRLRAAK